MINPVTWISRKCPIYSFYNNWNWFRSMSAGYIKVMMSSNTMTTLSVYWSISVISLLKPKTLNYLEPSEQNFLELIRYRIICVSRHARCKHGTIFLEFLSKHNIFRFWLHRFVCLLVESILIGYGSLQQLTPQFLWVSKAGAIRNSSLAASRLLKILLINIVLYLLNEFNFLLLNFICVHISTIISKYIRKEKRSR